MRKVKFIPEAEDDLKDIDQSIRIKILKAIKKLETAPLDYGETLGHHLGKKLTGLRKIQPADGFRVVYWVINDEVLVLIVAIGKRNRHRVYKTAAERIAEYRNMTGKELEKITEILNNISFGK